MCPAKCGYSTQRGLRLAPWLGLALGILVCGEPLMASALDFKPPRRGIPGRREGGGTRGAVADPCGDPRSAAFAALMPKTNFGLTTAEFPRFFWSVPRTKARFAEFTLHEAVAADAKNPDQKMSDRALVYRTTFRISGEAGVANMGLPTNAGIPGLAAGQDYHWTVSLICNTQDRKKDVKVEGWVQRVAPDAALSSQLFKANASDRPQIYATNGIWLDTLTSLADLRYASPLDTKLDQTWADLLKAIELPNSAPLPLLQPPNK